VLVHGEGWPGGAELRLAGEAVRITLNDGDLGCQRLAEQRGGLVLGAQRGRVAGGEATERGRPG
jgi:hypothetical protein